jgi:hypothetical protein
MSRKVLKSLRTLSNERVMRWHGVVDDALFIRGVAGANRNRAAAMKSGSKRKSRSNPVRVNA